MNDLVERLSTGIHPITANRYTSAKDFEEAVNRGYVLVKFTDTRGGTELGIRIDKDASKLDAVDFGQSTGTIHLEGNLILNYVKVRCVVEIDIKTLTGTGNLLVLEEVAK